MGGNILTVQGTHHQDRMQDKRHREERACNRELPVTGDVSTLCELIMQTPLVLQHKPDFPQVAIPGKSSTRNQDPEPCAQKTAGKIHASLGDVRVQEEYRKRFHDLGKQVLQ